MLALQAPTKYEQVVNLKTAKMLDLDLPAGRDIAPRLSGRLAHNFAVGPIML